MIPKIIHYCWFGGAPLPPLAQKCISSWKKHCPDYKIVEWNERNYPLTLAPDYVKEAIAAKRWAFATDVIRLDVVYQHGGIYLDTDVELLRNLDDLLCHHAFFGRDRGGMISTGLGFGAEPQCGVVRKLLEDYATAHFQTGNLRYDLQPCPQRNKKVFDSYGFSDATEEIEERKAVTVYPWEYFSPMSEKTMEVRLTTHTYSIHHFVASWKTPRERRSHERRLALERWFGETWGNRFADILNGLIRKMYKIWD